MQSELHTFNEQVNYARFHGQTGGFYESYFLRANHPARPFAFWIRYTLFCPKDAPDKNLGEIWVTYFNGESNRHIVVKQEYPLAESLFDPSAFNVQIGSAKLSSQFFQGTVENSDRSIAWDMKFTGHTSPLLLLPLNLYKGKFPAAKSLVSLPFAQFNGTLTVNGELINVSDWIGSQNHNWGIKHTDLYAWGQVAGFDSHPDSFLELATARLRMGPVWTPPITPIVFRHRQKEYALNEIPRGMKARGKFQYFTWDFKSKNKSVEIEGQISAPDHAFIGLKYYNPPGGNKYCLNSKIASCSLEFRDLHSGKTEVLTTKHRAAFEILTDDLDHGIEISA